MLRAYFISNDSRKDIIRILRLSNYKSIFIGTDGIVVKYEVHEDLVFIEKIIKESITSHKDLGNITMTEIDRYKRIPFNYLDMEEIKEYLQEIK